MAEHEGGLMKSVYISRSTRGLLVILSALLINACGGGSQSSAPGASEPPPNTGNNGDSGCSGQCATAQTKLTAADVSAIIAQAVAEASAQARPATIAVVDRVGNVLGVYQMAGAPETITVRSGKGQIGGLEEISVIPSTAAAISKAITPAYLSSEGNAFTTRTASQIVQENFNPGETGQAAGPLFGVQFSQLPCSDFSMRFNGTPGPGTHRAPLGFAADPGGLPLYMDGALVGGIGIESDGIYGLDTNLSDRDLLPDEIIAVAGSFGYGAPTDRRADRITVEGKTLRFSDARDSDLATDPALAPALSNLDPSTGSLVPVRGYFDGVILTGTAYGQPESGVRPANGEFPDDLDSFILVDATNTNRFAPRDGTDGPGALTSQEVRTMLIESIRVANRTRAQVRRPLGVQARVSVHVVDTNGVILGTLLTRDPLLDSLDVTLQKARSVAFFSGDYAGDDLRSAPNAIYRNPDGSEASQVVIGDYVTDFQNFMGMPTALDDGAFGFSDRSIGNLGRPFYPDGATGSINGPLSKPIDMWSPFNVGLQLDLVVNQVVNHVLFLLGATDTDVPRNCTGIDRIPNGITAFPGAVPIYRGNQLVGAIASSGDGIEQDDMIPFLGLNNAGEILGTIGNAPMAMRSDQLEPQGVRLRYVFCPQAPFLDSDERDVCTGK